MDPATAGSPALPPDVPSLCASDRSHDACGDASVCETASCPAPGDVGHADAGAREADAGDAEVPVPDASSPLTDPWEVPRDRVHLFLSGHSLFNLWMPAMLRQIAQELGRDHHYNMQMGLGSSMRSRLMGTRTEQDRSGARVEFDVLEEIGEASTLEGGRRYDTLMVTEIVPLLSQLRATESIANLRTFYDALREADPDGRVLLYDSWDHVPEGEDFAGWIESQRRQFVIWECLASAVNADPEVALNPIRIISGGMALAWVVEATLAGQITGIESPRVYFDEDVFHLSNLGNYVIALAVYSGLYARSPVGAPHALLDPWNQPLDGMPTPESAQALQAALWDFSTHFYGAPPDVARAPEECRVLVRDFCDGHHPCLDGIDAAFSE